MGKEREKHERLDEKNLREQETACPIYVYIRPAPSTIPHALMGTE